MSSLLVFSVVFGYFLLLVLVSGMTSRGANSETFFTANQKSPWYLVAFGMIGASLSGVTFISVPGEVGHSAFTYLQFVFGNLFGYWIVALVLLPLYYRLHLVSIYGYLEQRLGRYSYKTGSFFFMVSRTIGAAFRLYLVAGVMQIAFFDAFGIPFGVTVLVSILLIWVYTFRGGIKTIVFTDVLQTLFLLGAVFLTIGFLIHKMDWSLSTAFSEIKADPLSRIFEWNWRAKNHFLKQFLSGVFMTIVMVGLDQDMMQKNLTCKTFKEAQKNMLWFSVVFVAAVFLFLCLGVLLYKFAAAEGIHPPVRTDDLYSVLALQHTNMWIGLAFLLGITAAAYSSADSALASLTTTFCVDYLSFQTRENKGKERVRKLVHLGFSLLLFIVIMIFRAINDESVVVALFRVAGYTYGPLLGMFAFGMLTRLHVRDRYVPFFAILAPALSFLIDRYSQELFFGYRFGFEILILNGGLVFLMLFLSRKKLENRVKKC